MRRMSQSETISSPSETTLNELSNAISHVEILIVFSGTQEYRFSQRGTNFIAN
jgi:hypothetical protein